MAKDDNIMTICVDTYEIFYKTEDYKFIYLFIYLLLELFVGF